MSVTTLDSRQEAGLKFGSYESNRSELENMGATVRDGVDATNPATMSPTRYDEVHFEFPHTGVYGSRNDEQKNRAARESNKRLMQESMQALGATKLRPGGFLRISEGGYPYRDSAGRNGMNLDELARKSGYSVAPSSPLGTRTIGRTGGDTVLLPNSIRHNYQAPSSPVPESIDTLVSASTHWLIKRAMVCGNPQLIWWVNYLGYHELARLLQQYLEMDDLDLLPDFSRTHHRKDKDDREPPPMGGQMLRDSLAATDHPIF